MLKRSLILVLIALCGLAFADFEISSLSPGQEFLRMLRGAVTPDIGILWELRDALINTVAFAFCGTFLGVLWGAGIAFLFHWHWIRIFCAFLRSIHELFWAFLLMPLVGLNPICGILAIAIPYSGIFAKVYAEIRQESNQGPLEGFL